jgi:hypothetical protein
MKGTEDMKQESEKQRRDGGPDKGRLSIRITGEIEPRKDEDTNPSRTLIPLYHARKHTLHFQATVSIFAALRISNILQNIK